MDARLFFFPPLFMLKLAKGFYYESMKKRGWNFEITSFFNYPSNVFVFLVSLIKIDCFYLIVLLKED